MTKVLLIDDHSMVRRGLKQILVSAFEKIIVDEADTSEEAISRVLKTEYDIILLEIALSEGNGIELLEELKKVKSNLKILILSMHSDERYIIQTLRAGASGYLTKSGSPMELVMGINTILSGKKYFGTNIVEKLFSELEKDPLEKAPHEVLTSRELQVLRLIASGKKLTDIAKELSLSLSTVSTYRLRILKKMDFRNNAEIIRYTLDYGLVE